MPLISPGASLIEILDHVHQAILGAPMPNVAWLAYLKIMPLANPITPFVQQILSPDYSMQPNVQR